VDFLRGESAAHHNLRAEEPQSDSPRFQSIAAEELGWLGRLRSSTAFPAPQARRDSRVIPHRVFPHKNSGLDLNLA
jgi:hypothetical protein